MRETYLDWYKKRMREFVQPDVFSLVSSSVREPWKELKEIHNSPASDYFERYYWTPNSYGHPALIQRIADKYHVNPLNILTTQGATNAVFLVCNALLNEGDHVIVETPYYEPLIHSPKTSKADISLLDRTTGFSSMMSILTSMLTPQTKMLILTDLQNPTGISLSESELSILAGKVTGVSPGIKIVIDEIYLDFKENRRRPASMIHPAYISISSLTKVYGLSILRCGWIFADGDTIKTLRDRQILISGIGSRYLETLSVQVFDNLEKLTLSTHTRMNRNRELAREMLSPCFEKGVLEGEILSEGCVSFLKVPGLNDTHELTDMLQRKYRLFIVPGKFFNAPQYIRVGIGEIETDRLPKALELFKEGIASYRSSVR